jgi:hypothetical protein
MSVDASTSHVKMLVRLEQDEDGYPPTTEDKSDCRSNSDPAAGCESQSSAQN